MVQTRPRGRPRQDPRVRRGQIMSAAIRLFAKEGYRNTDLQKIADAVGIAKGTIYLYFETKRELFFAAVEHALERLAEWIDSETEAATGSIEKIRAMVRAYFNFVDKDHLLVGIIAQERGEFIAHAEDTCYRAFSENAHHLEAIIRKGIAEGVFREQDPERTAEILANLLTGTIYTYILRKKGQASEAIDEVTDFLLHGMLVEGKAQ